jgi:hypothetical protein
MLYNAHAVHGWLAAGIPVVKAWRHSDGEPCFGGGWFIVVAELPSGQVSNHYKEEHWDMFDVPEVELPPTYDGHTPKDATTRLLAALSALPSRVKALGEVVEAAVEFESAYEKGIGRRQSAAKSGVMKAVRAYLTPRDGEKPA